MVTAQTHRKMPWKFKILQKYGTMVTLGSDAHIDVDIANTEYSDKVLKAADFPVELIANTSS